jgi:peptidyl-prolyl cis-trans isomerase A (cyclophilin A)|tara:strand:+ start:1714 stop:2295 length:582 start_codon:yes stop_codon:yes gene_type:complete
MVSVVAKLLLFVLCSAWLPLAHAEPEDANPLVVLTTNLGAITIQLDAEKAPISVANFLAYVDAGFYSNTLFHRVIPGFMIQGGGYGLKLEDKENMAPIKNEAANGLNNVRGSVALARTSVIDSATSQFFINTVDNAFLNHTATNFGYAVFGKVIEGMEVVDKIEMTKTKPSGGHANLPVEPVIVQSASRLSRQ